MHYGGMTSDEEFLAQRRLADQRKFLISSLDPEKAPRLAPAVLAVRAHLAGRGWRSVTSALAAGVRASDVAVKTVDNMIRMAAKCGLIEWRGEYRQAWRGRQKVDTREVRLVDWPDIVD